MPLAIRPYQKIDMVTSVCATLLGHTVHIEGEMAIDESAAEVLTQKN